MELKTSRRNKAIVRDSIVLKPFARKVNRIPKAKIGIIPSSIGYSKFT